jgi:hypothetical protein
MPEIKHQFMGGKMDKDSDERLVPNGEYRDAMNIQVATSEGSDVGTAQNILGNEEVITYIPNASGVYDTNSPTFAWPADAQVIGALSDEKIDTMYYLVWTQIADYILSWRRGDTSPEFVFVDVNKNILKFPGDKIITGINVIDGLLFWTDNVNEPRKINVQRCKEGTTSAANALTQTQLRNNMSGVMVPIEEKHITVIKKGPQVALDMELLTHRDSSKIYTAVIEVSPTDDGTSSFTSSTTGIAISPNPPGMHDFSALTTEDGSNVFAIRIENGLDSFGLLQQLTSINIADGIGSIVGGPVEMLDGMSAGPGSIMTQFVGQKVVLQAYDDDGTPPGLPLTDFVIRGVIDDIGNNAPNILNNNGTNYFNVLYIKATSIDGSPEVAADTNLKYVVDFFDETEKLFEFKYPRFSYRYKFEDGEYSTFAPFTQVAFTPGSFDYHPRKGYNIGMTNRLSKINLFNAVTEETPDDVTAVEILFKDDSSPSIYVVDTIKPDDYSTPGSINTWDSMKASSANATLAPTPFVIDKEAVNSVVPSNQLLRPWDNIPKKALAQDITGNRIVYANYVQNYNLISQNGKKYVPDFSVAVNNGFGEGPSGIQFLWEGSTTGDVFKSIKSLREYQLGVVFLDEFGRETPVLSNASGTVKVDKALASDANRFEVQFNSDDYPQTLTHFKFFVKETSSEYYNMAMDRWYSAGDGNIWLAFPSSDRNKIDIDTFLILKKGSDQNTLVTEAARYKVLAIESEAPDFIKTTKRKAVVVAHQPGSTKDIFGTATTLDAPLEGFSEFKMNYQAFFGTSGKDLVDSEDELWIEFGLIGLDEVSARYKISSLANDFDGTTITGSKYSVQLDEPLGDDVNFITDDPSGVAPSAILSGAIVNIYKYKVENLDRFDGRFFVKIYFDEVFRNNIDSTLIGGGIRIAASNKVYSMENNMQQRHINPNGVGAGSAVGHHFLTKGKGAAKSPSSWKPYISGQMNNDIPYGYYNVDQFTAHALYFRKYTVQPYDWEDGVGILQTGLQAFGNDNNDGALNSNNFQVLVHLQDTNAASAVVDYANSHSGQYFRPADDWHKEFGYHTSSTSTLHRALRSDEDGDVFNGGMGGGLTTNWQKMSPNNQNPLTAYRYFFEDNDPDAYDSDMASARDNEVWFIDKGYREGQITSYTTQSLWPATNINTTDYGLGIDTGPAHWNMELGFGGIIGGGVNADETPPGFWEVGDWSTSNGGNPNYKDGATVAFVNKLKTGYTFRWKEDPEQTIYTITGSATEGARMRHSYGPVIQQNAPFTANTVTSDKSYSVTGVGNSQNVARPEDLNSMAEKLSFNLTKKFQLNGIKKSDGTGLLTWNPNVIGSIAGGINLPLVSVLESNLTGDGTALSDDLKVYVGDIAGTDALRSVAATLHEGMALESFVNSAGATVLITDAGSSSPKNDFLVVRKINKLPSPSTNYELILSGYEFPLQAAEHTALLAGIDEGKNLTFVQVGMNGYSPNSEFNINTVGRDYGCGAIGAVGYTLEFIDEIQPTEVLSENPAIWETEPKDSTPLDIYYEACGSIPMSIDASNVADAFPIGTKLPQFIIGGGGLYTVVGYNQEEIIVENYGVSSGTPIIVSLQYFFRPDDLIIKTDMLTINALGGGRWSIKVEGELTDNKFELPWHNCYSFGNGVESNRIRDTYNAPFISNGVKASTTLEQEYKEEHRKYGLIYSGIYNSTSGINNLNQFIQAEKITKDINPKHGSIQKLYSRDSDLVALCEDKILRIQANKDALFNADGNPQLIATDRVLGQAMPFSGEYGISTNPESFAADSYRAYFTDRVRGAVVRLSKDGLTPISDHGMKDWFRDNLKNHRKLVGSFDDRNDEYNINLTNYNTVFVNGFIPGAIGLVDDNVATNPFAPATPVTPSSDGIFITARDWASIPNVSSINVGSAISFLDPDTGDLLVPHETMVTSIETGIPLVSNFVGGGSIVDNYVKLGISNPIVNQTTGVPPEYFVYPNPDDGQVIGAGFMNFGKPVKFRITLSGFEENKLVSFSERVRGWVSFKSFENMQMGISLANDYYTFDRGNLYLHYSENQDRNTFYSVFTPSTLDVVLNDQPGLVKVFNTLNYEGSQSKVDKFTSVSPPIPLQPLTIYNDQEYYNLSDKPGWFVESIVTNEEEGKVNEFLDKEGKWFNYINKNVNTKIKADTSDFTFQGIGFASASSGGGGCIDPDAVNYNPNATVDNGSCIYDGVVYGCTDPNATNYDPNATSQDAFNNGTCIYPAGCLECYQAGADTSVPGCCDDTMVNYDPLATCNDLSCIAFIYGCTDPLALNYYGGADADNGSCVYVAGCTDATASNYNSLADYDDGSCTYGPVISLLGCTDPTATNYDANATSDDGSCAYGPAIACTHVPDPAFRGMISNIINFGAAVGCPAEHAVTAHLNTIPQSLGNSASNLGIVDLTGIEEMHALQTLFVANPSGLNGGIVGSVDFSNNPVLATINLYGNPGITSVNVSNNSLLYYFNVMNCNLTSLDLSSNPALITLAASGNQLTFLDLRSGGNTLVNYINVTNSNGLGSVYVDNVAYANTNWIAPSFTFPNTVTFTL